MWHLQSSWIVLSCVAKPGRIVYVRLRVVHMWSIKWSLLAVSSAGSDCSRQWFCITICGHMFGMIWEASIMSFLKSAVKLKAIFKNIELFRKFLSRDWGFPRGYISFILKREVLIHRLLQFWSQASLREFYDQSKLRRLTLMKCANWSIFHCIPRAPMCFYVLFCFPKISIQRKKWLRFVLGSRTVI